MRKLKLLLAACALMGGVSSVNAFQTPTADGIYYIYNQLTGKFMSRGSSWGTRAIVDDYGVPVKLVATESNFYFKGADNELYLSDDGWMYSDGGTDRYRAISITPVEGKEGTYTFTNTNNSLLIYVYLNEDDNKYAIAGNATKNDNYTDDGQTEWQFVNQDEYDAIIAAKHLDNHITIASAVEKEITTEADFISLLENQFETIDVTEEYLGNDLLNGGAGNWTVNGVRKLDDSWATFVGGGNGVAESFSAATSVTKELTGLKPGIYKVSMNGFFRQGNNGVCWSNKEAGFLPSNAYLKAGNYSTALKAWGLKATKYKEGDEDKYTPDNTSQAATAFANGDYTNEVYAYVGEDGKLTLSVNIPNFISWAGWACYNNVQLTYYRDKSEAKTLVENITLSKSSADLTTGDALTLTATISPDNADDKSYTWSSNNESVATVTNGVVVALSEGTATITATANDGGDASGSCTVTVTNAAETHNWTVLPEDFDQGDFFIRNVATGKFLGGANDWGTQASLIKHGIPFGLVKAPDGTYTLDSYTYEKAKHYFNGQYVDQESTKIYITSLGDGKYALSTANGSDFVTAKAGTTIVDNSATSSDAKFAQWQFLSCDDMLKNLKDGDTDATFILSEANISRNLRKSSGSSAWVGEFSYGGNNDNQCAESFHKATTVYQTITVPNGTYTVRVQGFYRPDEGSEGPSYLYANVGGDDISQAIKALGQEGDANDMSSASARFSEGKYWNELEVTVTNNRLTVGIKTDDENNWTIWDNFELVLTDKTGLQGTESSVDAYLTADNGTTYIYRGADSGTEGIVSATNELYATITTNIAGISTISFKEKVEKDDGLLRERLFWNEEKVYTDGKRHVEKNYHHHYWKIEGNKLRNIEDGRYLGVKDGVLTMVSEEGAADWTFDPKATKADLQALKNKAEGDTHVFGFEEGEYAPYNNIAGITAVAEGAAIDVTKDYPSLKIAAQSVALDDAWTANSEEVNAIYDGSFGAEYSHDGNVKPTGWTGGTNHDNANDVRYMWQVEQNPGLAATTNSTALFTKYDAYYGKAVGYTMPLKANTTYKLTFKYGTWGTEDHQTRGDAYVQMEDGNANTITINPSSLALTKEQRGANASVEKWYEFTGYFTTTDAGNYLLDLLKSTTNQQNQYVYGDIVLKKATGNDLKEALQQEIESTTVANVGTGIFQRPVSAGNALTSAKTTAQGVYDNSSASYDDVQNAIDALKAAKETYNNAELNAPDADKRYNLTIVEESKAWNGNAVTFIAAGRTDQGNYGVKYLAPVNANLNQALKFTAVEGEANTYKISAIRVENGGEQYLTTVAAYEEGNDNIRIRTTDNADQAMKIKVEATATEGQFQLRNVAANKIIANNNNNDMYTANSANFTIAEASKASVEVKIAEDVKYATAIFPFTPEELSGVTFYSCAAAEGNTLTLEPVTSPEANKPYILESTAAVNQTLEGWGTAVSETITEGWLTGVFAETTAPVGSYVLQNLNDVVGFYKVAEGENKQPKVGANHAYMTIPATEPEARALYFDNATAIKAIETLTSGEAEIYNAAGARQNSLQKGVNIIKQGNKTYKVMVK